MVDGKCDGRDGSHVGSKGFGLQYFSFIGVLAVILVATMHDTLPVYGEVALAVGVCNAPSSHVFRRIRLRSFEMFVFDLDKNSRDIAPANPN
jgi:hypothetical protein